MAYGSSDDACFYQTRIEAMEFLIMPFLNEARKNLVPLDSIQEGDWFITEKFVAYQIGKGLGQVDPKTFTLKDASVEVSFGNNTLVWSWDTQNEILKNIARHNV